MYIGIDIEMSQEEMSNHVIIEATYKAYTQYCLENKIERAGFTSWYKASKVTRGNHHVGPPVFENSLVPEAKFKISLSHTKNIFYVAIAVMEHLESEEDEGNSYLECVIHDNVYYDMTIYIKDKMVYLTIHVRHNGEEAWGRSHEPDINDIVNDVEGLIDRAFYYLLLDNPKFKKLFDTCTKVETEVFKKVLKAVKKHYEKV